MIEILAASLLQLEVKHERLTQLTAIALGLLQQHLTGAEVKPEQIAELITELESLTIDH